MNKKLLLGILFLSTIVFVSACTNNTIKPENSVAVEQDNSKFIRKTSESTVTIDLEPHKYSNGVLDIDISLNTHSVDMSKIDLKEQAKLVMNDQEYYPVDAPSLSGHHNSGTLRFEIPNEPGEHKIIITGIPDIEERVFSWP